MITSAHICYESSKTNLELQLLGTLIEQNTSWETMPTEWSDCGIVIPQLIVLTPIPFIIQIENDPDWVPEENKEFAEWAGLSEEDELFLKLSRCDARLAIQSIAPDQITLTGKEIIAFVFGGVVDPRNSDISNVLAIIGKEISGVLNDCVNEELLQY
ncbi:hypothetical protein ACMFY5_27595 [Pseudomonas sihuiensis]|jgi:hypothetical protein